jgi:hypothetical protein
VIPCIVWKLEACIAAHCSRLSDPSFDQFKAVVKAFGRGSACSNAGVLVVDGAGGGLAATATGLRVRTTALVVRS